MYKISYYGSFSLFWMSSSKLKTFQSPCIQMTSHVLKKLLKERVREGKREGATMPLYGQEIIRILIISTEVLQVLIHAQYVVDREK